MSAKPIKLVGIVSMFAGAAMAVAGVASWVTASEQLKAEKITVPGDAPFLAGAQVAGPFTAFAQAETIKKHAAAATEGKSFAELGALASEAKAAGNEELARQYDEKRATAQTASFLRASLMTSVIAFGVSGLVAGLGALSGLTGWALLRLGRQSEAQQAKA